MYWSRFSLENTNDVPVMILSLNMGDYVMTWPRWLHDTKLHNISSSLEKVDSNLKIQMKMKMKIQKKLFLISHMWSVHDSYEPITNSDNDISWSETTLKGWTIIIHLTQYQIQPILITEIRQMVSDLW